MRLGAIEAGGTKFICSIANENAKIEIQKRILTTTPEETLDQVISFFQKSNIEAIGIGSFGPVNVDEKSDNYGCIMNSPKVLWQNFNVKKYLERSLTVPLFFDTDVNVACYGEYIKSFFGKNIVYVTVGTGVGVGAIINGKILTGSYNTEMGHIRVKRSENDSFKGCCPFHNDCLEGLVSGPAILAKYGKKGEELSSNNDVWDLVGFYLAQALINYSYILVPDKILIGGGIGLKDEVIASTKKYFNLLNNHYININDNIIEKATLGKDAGTIGAILFAYNKLVNVE